MLFTLFALVITRSPDDDDSMPTPTPPSAGVMPVPPPSPPSPPSVDDLLRTMRWGNAAFDAPSQMRRGETKVVELVLSGSLSGAQLKQQLASHAEQGDAAVARVRFSDRMEARLTGNGFEIQPLTPELQAVSSRGTTRWRWSAKPVEAGSQNLYVSLSAHIEIDGDDTQYVVRTFDHTIQVQVTVGQRVASFVSGNWQWLWTAILVPLAPLAWKRLRGRGKRPRGLSAAR